MQVDEPKDDQVAADFYNQLNRSHDTQAQSQIYHLRRFNNWVKMMLITEVWLDDTPLGTMVKKKKERSLRVLDLACGKGGDLAKIQRLPILKYAGLDIAEASLEDLAKRLADDRNDDIEFRLVAANLGARSLREHGNWRVYNHHTKEWRSEEKAVGGEKFDVASMQFALHYVFATRERASTFFADVGALLRPGGVFLVTTVDAAALAALVLSKGGRKKIDNGIWWRADIEDELYDDALTGLNSVSERPEKPRVPLTVWLEDETRNRLVTSSQQSVEEEDSGFGLRYWFQLRDDAMSNEAFAVDSPEWLAPRHVLEDVAEKHGLELVKYDNFADFLNDNTQQNLRSLRGMGVPDAVRGSLSPAEWDIARLYAAIVFRKKPSDMDMVKALGKVKSQIDPNVWTNLTGAQKTALSRDCAQGGERWQAFQKK